MRAPLTIDAALSTTVSAAFTDAYAELAGVREDDVAALADVTAWAPPSND